jgi:hypothetical protein
VPKATAIVQSPMILNFSVSSLLMFTTLSNSWFVVIV